MAVLENGDDLSHEMIDLAIRQRAFAALERDTNKQRILAGRDIFPTE